MKVQIETIERLNLSVNGNPRFALTYSPVDADLGAYSDTAVTKSDASFNYEIGNLGFRAGDIVEMEFTKAGRIAGIKVAS